MVKYPYAVLQRSKKERMVIYMTGILWYDTVICVLVFIFGSVIGSFLNVVIYRTPLHMSIVNGPSHCFSCGERIKPYDLVPIFSWIFLGGKCRKCKAPISARYTVVEALTGIMFLLAYIRFSASLPMVVAIVFFSLLIVLSCIDIDHMEIPYWCTISIAVLGIATFFTEPNMPWWEHFAGAAVIAVPFAILALFGGMGGGDVQLMAASGFVLGWKIVPSAVIGVVVGAVYGLIVLCVSSRFTKERSAKISEKLTDWCECKAVDNSKDVIIGEFEHGKCKIDPELFEEKAWNLSGDELKAATQSLSNELNEVMGELPDSKEYVFRANVENGKITKIKLRRRIAFGPALSVGLAVGMLCGETIIKAYLSML